MEDRLCPRQQLQRDYRLSDSVGNSRNTKNSCPTAMRFRNFDRPHRRRKVRPRHTCAGNTMRYAPSAHPGAGQIGQQRPQPGPLLVGQIMTMQHGPVYRIRTSRSAGHASFEVGVLRSAEGIVDP